MASFVIRYVYGPWRTSPAAIRILARNLSVRIRYHD
jgi:hypothetical protein